jgi:tetratricopeptide (TPR) repeat protein
LIAALLLGPALALVGCGESVEERLAAAKELQDGQQFEQSLEPLRSVLAQEPGQPEASFRLGLALAKTGQLSGAIFPLRQAAESDAHAVGAGLMLAQVYLATGNQDQAHDAATKVLEHDPNQVEALALRIQTGNGRGEYEAMLADAERLSQLDPGPRGLEMKIAALEPLARFDEERKVLSDLEAMQRQRGDLAEAARACAVRAASFEKSDRNLTRGVPAIEQCLSEYPTQQIVLETASGVLPLERVLERWRKAADDAPESLDLRLGYASRLRAAGKLDEATAVTRTAAEDFRSVDAWLALATLESSLGHLDEADAALQSAAAAAPQQAETIALRRADLRTMAGDYDGAEKIAQDIHDDALANIVRGHVLFERGDAEGALGLLEKALERYPNHPGARTLAGRAAERLGQTDRALAHYREVVRVDPAATNAPVLGAALAMALGRNADAAEYIGRYLEAVKAAPEARAYSLGIRSAYLAGMTDVSARFLELLGQRRDLAAQYAVEKAWLAQQKGGVEAAARSLAASDVDLSDPATEPALRALVDAELATGQDDQALARIDAALRKHPDRASLHDARGRALLHAGRLDGARAEFERALARNPSYGPAKAGLGVLAFQAGDLAQALSLFDEAVDAPIPDPEAAYRAAQVAQALGRKDEAERRYRSALADQPDHVGANNDLAWVLAEQNKSLDTALELAQRAVRLSPMASTWDTLAYVQMQRGEGDAARQTLEGALEKQAGQPTLLYRLALVRESAGDREGAANALRQALQAGAFPEAEAARTELARLEKRSDS